MNAADEVDGESSSLGKGMPRIVVFVKRFESSTSQTSAAAARLRLRTEVVEGRRDMMRRKEGGSEEAMGVREVVPHVLPSVACLRMVTAMCVCGGGGRHGYEMRQRVRVCGCVPVVHKAGARNFWLQKEPRDVRVVGEERRRRHRTLGSNKSGRSTRTLAKRCEIEGCDKKRWQEMTMDGRASRYGGSSSVTGDLLAP